MRHIFIMYMPGHAGNFLARLCSLNFSTMPQLPKKMLDTFINSGLGIDDINRLALYSFASASKFKNWQDFHRSWADYYDNIKFNLFNVFLSDHRNDKKTIIYNIHPHELSFFSNQIKQIDNAEFYYVSLDKKYNYWVENNRAKLNFIWRDNEENQFYEFTKMYSMQPVKLTKMLDSESEFLNEYHRISELMSITPDDQALQLYYDWKGIRCN